MHTHEMHVHEMHACKVQAHETHAHEVYPYEIYTCETHADEMHAHRSVAFLEGGCGSAGVAKGYPRTNPGFWGRSAFSDSWLSELGRLTYNTQLDLYPVQHSQGRDI